MKKNPGRGKAGIDFHPQRLGLLRQPAAQIAKADDVVAVIVHLRWGGQPQGAGLGEEQETVLFGEGTQRCIQRFPVWDQFVEGTGLDDGTRKDMGAHLGAFFHHADADLAVCFSAQLLHADSGREPGRAGTNDDYIVFHDLMLHGDSLVKVCRQRPPTVLNSHHEHRR